MVNIVKIFIGVLIAGWIAFFAILPSSYCYTEHIETVRLCPIPLHTTIPFKLINRIEKNEPTDLCCMNITHDNEVCVDSYTKDISVPNDRFKDLSSVLFLSTAIFGWMLFSSIFVRPGGGESAHNLIVIIWTSPILLLCLRVVQVIGGPLIAKKMCVPVVI